MYLRYRFHFYFQFFQVYENYFDFGVIRPCSNDNTTEKIVTGSKMTYKRTVKLVGITFVILIYEDSVVQCMSNSQKREMR